MILSEALINEELIKEHTYITFNYNASEMKNLLNITTIPYIVLLGWFIWYTGFYGIPVAKLKI